MAMAIAQASCHGLDLAVGTDAVFVQGIVNCITLLLFFFLDSVRQELAMLEITIAY